jgi:uncharacterized membrane protein
MNFDKTLSRFRDSVGKPENVFLILGATFAILFCIATPALLVGDEPTHFYRSYQISEGQLVGEKQGDLSGGWLPKSVLYTKEKLTGNIEMNPEVKFDTEVLPELYNLPLNNDDQVFERFPNTVVYTPIPYVPQVIGILIGKTFGASPLVLIYLARIVNILFFLGFAYAVIKKTPFHKWVFCLLCLTPTFVFQGASASVDVFTLGICFLTTAYFLSFAFDENNKLEKPDIAKIFILCWLTVLSKQAYVFLPLLFLIIPYRKFNSVRTYLITFVSLIAVCWGSVAVWAKFAVKPIYTQYRTDIAINPDEQTAFIISNPFTFLKIAVTDYILHGKYYFHGFFGQLTWLDLSVPVYLPEFLFLLMLAFAMLDKESKIIVSKFSKSVFFAIFVGTLLLISAVLYMTWSPIHGNDINGIQGRYFIPLGPLFFLLFYNRRLTWLALDKYAHMIVYLSVIVSLLITLNTIYKRYYV